MTAAWWVPTNESEEYALYAIVAIVLLGCCAIVVACSALCWCKCCRGSDVSAAAARTQRSAGGAEHARVPVEPPSLDVELAAASSSSAAAARASAPPGALPLSDGEEAKVVPPAAQDREEQRVLLKPADVAAATAEARFAAARRAAPGAARRGTPAARALTLHALPDLASSVFERNWDVLDVRAQWRSSAYVSALDARARGAAGVRDDALIELLAASFVFCIASGRVGDVSKHYYYSVDEPSGDLFFAELLIDAAHGVRGSVKSTCASPRTVEAYGALVQRAVEALAREM